MGKTIINRGRYYLKWALWILLVQIVLVNISAALYAYKFTHFYDRPATLYQTQNIFGKTWKLFAGPNFYKNTRQGEPSFPYESINFKTDDGILIHGWYGKADNAKGCVIFFHGIMVNKTYLEAEASVFRNLGYNVLLIDFRAHGKSSGYTTSFGIDEVQEVQNAFKFASSKGNEKIILYGVSLGAGVCIRAVSEGLVQPAAIIADMPFGKLQNYLKARAADVGFPQEPFATLVTFWIGVQQGYNGFRHNTAAYAKNIHCPVLVEWGEKDRYVNRDEIEEVYKNIASPNKRLVTYAGADHQSYLQNDPNLWKDQVALFLQSIP